MIYDLVVIGSGPGGYVCAIKAAQLGLKVAVVEKRDTFGGTCLNIGCIPSKALLHASEQFHLANHSFETLGIDISKPKLNLPKMMTHKQSVVDANVKGVAFLFKKNKIDTIIGTGSILSANQIQVTRSNGTTAIIETKNCVIATGSDVAGIPGIDVHIDEQVIVSSTGALSFDKVPQHLVVVGGGVIGLELGSVYMRLGSKVTVIEYMDGILAGMDKEVSKQFQKILEKQGMEFKLGAKVIGVTRTKKGANVVYETLSNSERSAIETDVVLIATGRKPFTQGLNLEACGIALDNRGRIEVDKEWQTCVKNIYAIGDVIKGPMLAHKAEDEGVAVAEILSGQHGHVNFDVIPSVVYTSPEVASVGKTEEELKAIGSDYKIGKFPFSANGRARAMQQTEGFVKILADSLTDTILGVHIIGHNAGDLIQECCVVMEFGGSSEDLARTCHAHPTLSETVREAALGTFAKSLHI
jgi:dihydrolipoamide dehydrogenase